MLSILKRRPALRKLKGRAAYFKRLVMLHIKRECFGAKIAWHYVFHRQEPRQIFFILCEHRSGSNLLIRYLNSVPGILCGGEILSRYQPYGLRRWRMPAAKALRHIRRFLNYRSCEIRGAKIFFVHLQELGLPLADMAKDFPQARWILLYRENLLDQFLSFKMAVKSQDWIRYENGILPKPVSIVLDPAEAERFSRQMRSWYEKAIQTEDLRERMLVISYEELAQDAQKIFDEKVFPFFNRPSVPVSTNLVKQNVRPVSEIISNYAEVKEWIQKTDFTQKYGLERP